MTPYVVTFCLLVVATVSLLQHEFGAKPVPPRPRAVLKCTGKFVTICAWCPTSPQATQWTLNQGLLPTHTICPDCRAKIL